MTAAARWALLAWIYVPAAVYVGVVAATAVQLRAARPADDDFAVLEGGRR